MGFAPTVRCNSAWRSPKGRQRFAQLVKAELTRNKARVPTPFDESTLLFLRQTLEASLSYDDDSTTLDRPPREVAEAARHVANVMRTKTLMRERLDAMRESACAQAVTPRGANAADRRAGLLVPDHAPNNPMYKRFIELQRQIMKT